jgi:type II secretory ATPase GspE/PulE/Tfp pilus assembly ATPase PilB-like protein
MVLLGPSQRLACRDTLDVPVLVDDLLDSALRARASDIHVEPAADHCEIRYRIDGLLQPARTVASDVGRLIVTRLMVLARLLTYRADLPQEGRATVNLPFSQAPLDLRVAVIPTTHGLRCAVRLPAELAQPRTLADLSLPARALAGLCRFAAADAGMLLLVGPAGSGKTTTLYALLAHIRAACDGLSIVALEDPVERHLPGVTQIEVSSFGPLTYERALRSILRQDPQVLMLGEIRDAATASLAVQAALSGHRICSTLHAASPAGAVARLIEMGVEPYQITSTLTGVLCQRLVRRRVGNGYAGRLPLAEFAELNEQARRVILARGDLAQLNAALAADPGYESLADSALVPLAAGLTDHAEIDRVLPPPPAAL